MKPNDQPVYVHKLSNNQPLSILKNIPHSVNKRLTTISANKDVFKSAIGQFQEALKKSGYDFELNFSNPNQSKKTNRNRTRNKTYFNSPLSQNVQTNIGQQLFKILDKCFPKNHPLSKIISRNTVKLRYKCMKNIKTQISRHNHRVQQPVDQ